MIEKESNEHKELPEPSGDHFLFSDRQLEVAKWRWAFIRLDRNYQKDFRQWKGTDWEVVITARWWLGELIDPKLTFDDICKEYKIPKYDNASEKQKKYWVIEKLGGLESEFIGIGITPLEELKLTKNYDWEDYKRDLSEVNGIVLAIDTTLPDSQIEREVLEWVKQYRALKNIPLKIEQDKLRRERYETYLKIWELKQKRFTHEKIADELLPDLDLDSARVRITRNLKSIKKLIAGPYRRNLEVRASH